MNNSIDAGAVIQRTFQIYIDQSPVLMPAAAVVFVFTGVLSAVLIAASPGLVLVAEPITLVATSLFTGMVVELVADVRDGRRDSSAGALLRAVTPVLGQLVLMGFVAAVLEGIGLVLLVIPGLMLITMWSVFAPVIVLERASGLRALGRSRELVRGNGWQVFAVIFVMFMLVGVLGTGLTLAAAVAGSGVELVVRVIVGVLGAPLVALAQAILYFDLGAARESPQGVIQDPPDPVQSSPFPPTGL
ncbi:MAG: YciC family protein [Solirubrobacteraceae bacterium]